MNRLLRILLLATAPLAVSGAAAAQSLDGVKLVEAGKLTYGVAASFAPFEYVNDGKLTGFDIDFIQALAEKLKVEPAAIKRTMLFTVEGEKDDICAVGQTLAAHDLCSSLRPYRKKHHMQAGVGHYGVFSGRTWQNQIYPMVKNVILQSD